MSRNSKWKLEQNKVKVVFRLQFHATHVPQSGWDKLFVSFITVDTGKVTAKTTKANVRNGMCKWADPIYETTRLLQNSKTKQFDDKLYKIVVAMGSSRSGTLGEATVNLSDYVDALKPSTLSVPLSGCSFGTVLHITVQLLTSKTGFREFEQQRELREGGFQSGHDSTGDSTTNKPYPDEIANGQNDKVNARVKFKTDVSELSSVGEEANLNEEYTDSNSAAGFDGSSNTSDSQYADKHEHDGLKNNVLSHLQSPYSEKGDASDHHNSPQDSSVSAREWTSNRSINNELTIACEENNRLRESLELAESSLVDLKLEVNSLQGLADELGTETQKLSHLLASEISSSQELAKEVYVMKSECSKFKDDIIKLQDLKLMSQTRIEARDHQVRVLKGIEVAEGKITELQKKAQVFNHDRDASFIHSELEALRNVLKDIKHGIDEQFPSENGFGLDLCQPESILQHFNMIPSISDVNNPTDAMKAQIFDLVRELDEAKVEKEAIIHKMHQMELYYEGLVQELEENQKLVIGELQHVRNEHSTCLYTLSANRAEMESMHDNILKLADERNEIESLNRELKKRATTSESALRRARLNYSIAVDKLQKDLELLSSQVVSMFESNESLIKQAFTEPSEDDDARKISQYQSSSLGIRKRSGGRDVILDDLKRSFCLQEELYQKVEEELVEMHSVNLNLDIYSKALEYSLLQANSDFRIMMKKMDELSEELEISTASQNQLMVRLQKATEDIHALNEYNSSCISQCNDMALQNQLLEDQIESISKENYLFGQKLKERDANYEACLGENAELSLLLKQETLENDKLQTEMSLMKENLMNLKSESDEVISLKRSLEENISFVQDKLCNLMASYNKQFDVSANYTGACLKDAISQLEKIQKNACDKIVELTKENQNLESGREIADASLNSARSEILAMKQKFKSEMESMVSKVDLSVALVGKLQTEFESVADKMQFSSEIEEKYAEQNRALLADLLLLENQMQELTCNSGHLSRDISGLDDLALEIGRGNSLVAVLTKAKEGLSLSLQDKTENLINLSGELCKEKAQKDELEVKVRDLTSQLNKDNDKFIVSLQEKKEESIKLASEIDCLKENLRNLQDELCKEKAQKDELEVKVIDLTSQLNKDNDKFVVSLQEKKGESIKLTSEIDCLKENLRNLQDELCKEKAQKDELEVKVIDLTSQLNKDNDKFVMSLQEKNEESIKLASEIDCLKENLRNLQDELEREKVCKDELERKFNDITSQLNKDKNEFAMSLHGKNEDAIKLVSEIDCLKEKLRNLQDDLVREKSCSDDLEKKFSGITSQLKKDNEELEISLQGKTEECFKLASEIDSLKANLRNLHNDFLKETTCKNELERKVGDLISQLNKGDDVFLRFELQKVELLNATKLASDLELKISELAYLNEQQKALIENLQKEISSQATLESLLFDMEDSTLAADVKFVYLLNQHDILHEELQNRHIDIEAVSNQCFESEVNWSGEKSNLLTILNSLKWDLESSKAQNQLLSNSNNEATDQLEDCKKELEKLKNMLKDDEEEITSLTISKEEHEILAIVLKDKITEKCVDMDLAEEYKDELTKLRLHCNELSRNLSEQVLKAEEFKNLSTHWKALKDKAEAECIVAREKRDDSPSAASQDSLRIAFLKEQYETKFQELTHQLSISKKHGEEMLIKLQDCINEIENRKKSEAISLRRNEELSLKLSTLEAELQSVIGEKREKVKAYDRTKVELECALLSLECCKEEKDKLEASFRDFEAEKSLLVNELTLLKGELDVLRSPTNELGTKIDIKLNGSMQNDEGVPTIQPETFVEESPKSNGKNLGGVQMLRSSMENLHDQLEKMKNENLEVDKNYNATNFHISETQLMQLRKANEELRNMFPSFNEISGGGNALENVLALEMELAESLQSKNKRNIQFQSSFLKQHSNEEAILKSFRDINELIMEMLELKGKHENLEAELREMHERYSQLSLQFAEVEGERQKLTMTLKSVRASRRLLRAPSADLPTP